MHFRNRPQKRTFRGRSLGFHSLEDRRMLAGDVVGDGDMVSVLQAGNGDIFVFGDDNQNDLLITTSTIDGAAFNVHIEGLNNTDLKFDGSFVPELNLVLLPGDNLSVYMGEGDDLLDVVGAGVPKNLFIDGEGGEDAIDVQQDEVGRRLTINGGDDNDTILVHHTDVVEDLRIDGGGGDDVTSVSDSDVGDDLFFYGRTGSDKLSLSMVDVDDLGNIRPGDGSDNAANSAGVDISMSEFGRLRVRADDGGAAGDGDDDVSVTDTHVIGATNIDVRHGSENSVTLKDNDFDGSVDVDARGASEDTVKIEGSPGIGGLLDVRTRGGDDSVELKDLAISSTLEVRSGGGEDHVTLDGVMVGSTTDILTGGANDKLKLKDSLFGSFVDAKLGGGADDLDVDTIDVTGGGALIDGQSGSDTISGLSGITGPLVPVSFP